MNKNYLHKSLAALLAAAALTGCAKDKEEFHYIDLSQVACTFQGEDNQPLTVSVITAPAAWSAAPDASWVTAEKGQDGESLTITVEDNTSGTEREARITVSAGQASAGTDTSSRSSPPDNLFAPSSETGYIPTGCGALAQRQICGRIRSLLSSGRLFSVLADHRGHRNRRMASVRALSGSTLLPDPGNVHFRPGSAVYYRRDARRPDSHRPHR